MSRRSRVGRKRSREDDEEETPEEELNDNLVDPVLEEGDTILEKESATTSR